MCISIIGRCSTQIVQIVAHCLIARILVSLIVAIISIICVKSAALFVGVIKAPFERFRNHLDAAFSLISLQILGLLDLLALLPSTIVTYSIHLFLIVWAIVRPCSISLILILLWLTYIIIINFHH